MTTEQPVNLKDGVYDEEEQRNSFLQALNAWRNAGKSEEQKSSKKVNKSDVERAWQF